jgi:orotate phosphoribosyltransferase
MESDVSRLLAARRGHFRFESGHHGDLWLDLELLCVQPEPLLRFSAELAARLAKANVQAVCGPLVEGAFVALLVALELKVPFVYSERRAEPGADGLYPVKYLLPGPLRARVREARVAIVNDVINAGSAVRGTLTDLERCGAKTVAIAALAVLGSSAAELAAAKDMPLVTLAALPSALWAPAECPLCAQGLPLAEG